MYNAESEHNKLRICPASASGAALPPADEQLALKCLKPDVQSIDSWSYKTRNSVLFNPEGAEFTEAEKIERMKMDQKEVCLENTRFGQAPFAESASSKDAVMAKAATIHLVANRGKFTIHGEEETIRDRNPAKFGFVVTPSPMPGVNESPLMTWGEIDGTPFRLDAADTPVPTTPGPVFKMPGVPLRDQLAQNMNEEIARRHREKRENAIRQITAHKSKTPKFTTSKRSTERLSSMSPAARRLATSKLGIRLGTDKALKASYTPSPMRQRGTTTPVLLSTTPGSRTGKNKDGSTIVKRKATSTTTSTISKSAASTSGGSGVSLTDNLLNLNSKRAQASDFF